ncbi:MAG: hypothetical protein GY801_03260 [bacterium]|nr:hypothetical protein [bacterium]
MAEESLVFNGINGATGDYLLKVTPEQISKVARGEKLDQDDLAQLERLNNRNTEGHLGPVERVNPLNLAETGWGVIFAHDADPAVKEALKELLDHRQAQAAKEHEHYYQEYIGHKAYRSGESTREFLARHKVSGVDAADPDKMPYYLLIVGDPESIPYRFQYQLDVQYAVGRIHFDTLEEYAQYARSVVEAETKKAFLPRQATFFGVQNPDDAATRLSAKELVNPLHEEVPQQLSEILKEQSPWSVRTLLEEQATKAQLSQVLGGDETPALIFTASHGMYFPKDDPHQLRHQGALLCQDWPGPLTWRDPIPEDHYFSADDVGEDANLLGLLAFHFACYGAGTPRLDDFARQASGEREAIAPHAFIARLPQRLLSHPKGGALAVVGHVERAWTYSFVWSDSGGQTGTFRDTLMRLMQGHPVGWAMEYFNTRHGALAVRLNQELEDIHFGKTTNDRELAGMWTANNDARNYVIIGDPAVRLPVGEEKIIEAKRPIIAPVEIRSPEPKPAETASLSRPASESASTGERQEGAADFSGVSESWKQAKDSLSNALQQFTATVGDTLKRSVDNVSSLEVAIYVSDDMSNVKYDVGTKQFTGNVKLRSLTRIDLDGDTIACLPEKDEEIDRDLWKIHMDMVQQAQAYRTELLKALTSVVTGVLGVSKET